MKSTTFSSLNGIALTFSEPEYKERIEHVKKIIVRHPQYEEVYNELEEVHITSQGSVQASQLNLSGRTGAGKTTIVKQYVERHPRKLTDTGTIIPVLYVKVPPRLKTPKALASKILGEMGDLFANSGTDEELGRSIVQFVRDCQTEMIILDEFQHLIDRDTLNVLATASDWLKLLTEELNIPVILCGLPESKDIFEYNEQIDGRYPRRIILEPFGFEEQAQQKKFRLFLKKLDGEMPFSEYSNLSDPMLASKIHYVTEGVPRYIKDILIEATKTSLKRGIDYINEDSLHDAFHRLTRSNQRYAINPFGDARFNYFDAIEIKRKKETAFINSQNDNSKRNNKKQTKKTS
ncbi:MAG: TniB family NTP-binding protein [Candidatus Pristimantibacillus lignocellulolyticus]|uniref:TniB family NTP-binding protein n=1 Tax=Candidatus Pristimantibacillus lignocellulolyticus TaxID=2994561 RepID=A0A9J6ZB78_9BACL|nr:MAG: TniB family NTP-binding protein [Candidatus Pristimantibacillus lignocellulolyticus]